MPINDSELHAQGASTFTDDIPEPLGTLHAFPVVSAIAHGKILALKLNAALAFPGVVQILSARDIPGINNIGNIEARRSIVGRSNSQVSGPGYRAGYCRNRNHRPARGGLGQR